MQLSRIEPHDLHAGVRMGAQVILTLPEMPQVKGANAEAVKPQGSHWEPIPLLYLVNCQTFVKSPFMLGLAEGVK